jgi:hypothetical protein
VLVIALLCCRSRKYVKPNAQKLRLWSQGLGKHVQLHVTTAALRYVYASAGRWLVATLSCPPGVRRHHHCCRVPLSLTGQSTEQGALIATC